MESSKHGIPPILLKLVFLIALDFNFDVTVNIHKFIPDVSEIDALYRPVRYQELVGFRTFLGKDRSNNILHREIGMWSQLTDSWACQTIDFKNI